MLTVVAVAPSPGANVPVPVLTSAPPLGAAKAPVCPTNDTIATRTAIRPPRRNAFIVFFLPFDGQSVLSTNYYERGGRRCRRLGAMPYMATSDGPYGSVTAPRSAPVTSRAYFASTPVV